MRSQSSLHQAVQNQISAITKRTFQSRFLLLFPLLFLLIIMCVPVQGYEGANPPLISPKVTDAFKRSRKQSVLIKLREPSDDPALHRSSESSEKAHFISRDNIRQLQRGLEIALSREINSKEFVIIHRLHVIPWITATITQRPLNV